MSTASQHALVHSLLVKKMAPGLIVACGVIIAALFGIVTRPVGFLAAFWPANAILLGMMVRWPKLCTVSGWVGAVAGYLLADLLTGLNPTDTVWLMTANVAGAVVGTFLFYHQSPEDRSLSGTTLMLNLMWISILVSVTSGSIGAWSEMVIHEKSWYRSFSFWFVGEFVNHLLLLSVILTTPSWGMLKAEFTEFFRDRHSILNNVMPLGTLLLSLLLATRIGGPGAIAFVAPGLMWCSVTYRRFTTAFLTLVTLAAILIADSAGVTRLIDPEYKSIDRTMSLRLGVALLALVPVMSASIYDARQQLIAQLSHSLQFDSLTETLARKYFLEMAAGRAIASTHTDTAIKTYCLMLDIDHFKRINDTFGHAAGDQVLKQFSKTVREQLRREDLFGRLGGEEFSVILSDVSADTSFKIAERIRLQVEQASVALPDGRSVSMTVSIGIACLQSSEASDLDQILIQADRALYTAKESGRNKVCLANSEDFVCQIA